MNSNQEARRVASKNRETLETHRLLFELRLKGNEILSNLNTLKLPCIEKSLQNVELKSDGSFYFRGWKLLFLQIGFQIYLFKIMNNCVDQHSRAYNDAVEFSGVFSVIFWSIHLFFVLYAFEALTSPVIPLTIRHLCGILCPSIKPIDLI